MKTWIVFGCSALAAACSNKPAEEPAHYAQSETTAPEESEVRGVGPEYGTAEANEPNRSAPEESAGAQGDPAPSQNRGTREDTPSDQSAAASNQPPPEAKPPQAAPDNTRVNKRDRSTEAMTPMDQGNSQTDLKITQQIRQAVMADDSLSFNAKNVKIITSNGKVTLRGVVNNDEERKTIDDQAKKVAGSTNVTDEIEVKK
jgi:hyperosmotically inducible periplasmic protein